MFSYKGGIMGKKVMQKVRPKIIEFKNRQTTIRPKAKQLFDSLVKKHSLPKEYFDKKVNRFASEFYALNDALKSKTSPVHPSEIKLTRGDPLYREKGELIATQLAEHMAGARPKNIGNAFEIRLKMILNSKNLSGPEKRKQLNLLITEIDSLSSGFEIGNKIKILESEVSTNVDRTTNIFKEIDSFLKSNSVNPVERKELLSFLESWKRNLRNTDAILREYKSKLSDIELLKQKIKIEILRA